MVKKVEFYTYQKFNLKYIVMSDSTNTFLGILAGTAIGAIVGILYAPDKGVNTRRKVSEKVLEARESLEERALDIKGTVADKLSNKKETLDSKVESIVSDVSYKTEDLITTLEQKLAALKAKNRKLQKTS